MLIVDGHADARTVVKVSRSGRLEFKENLFKDLPKFFWWRDEKVLETITACLSEEVLQAVTWRGLELNCTS